jgi:cell division control protein 7
MATIRPRNAKVPFEIHHDVLDRTESLDGEDQVMEESRDERDEVDVQEEEYSDISDEDEVADPALQEDMIKFQETFKGINERFRLIGRIGEGRLIHIYN